MRDQPPLCARGPAAGGAAGSACAGSGPGSPAPAPRARSRPARRRTASGRAGRGWCRSAWTVTSRTAGSLGLKPGSTNEQVDLRPAVVLPQRRPAGRVPVGRGAAVVAGRGAPSRTARTRSARRGYAADARHRVDRVDLGGQRPVDVGDDPVLELRLGQADRLGDRGNRFTTGVQPSRKFSGWTARSRAAAGSGRRGRRSCRRSRGPPASRAGQVEEEELLREARSIPGAADSRGTSGGIGEHPLVAARSRPARSRRAAGRPSRLPAVAGLAPDPDLADVVEQQLVERVEDGAVAVEVEPEPVERRARRRSGPRAPRSASWSSATASGGLPGKTTRSGSSRAASTSIGQSVTG